MNARCMTLYEKKKRTYLISPSRFRQSVYRILIHRVALLDDSYFYFNFFLFINILERVVLKIVIYPSSFLL